MSTGLFVGTLVFHTVDRSGNNLLQVLPNVYSWVGAKTAIASEQAVVDHL